MNIDLKISVGFAFLLIIESVVVLRCDATVVELNLGKVKGITEFSVSGKRIYSFLGIPYAKPPVGRLRLKDPVEIGNWKATLDATKMPDLCLQPKMEDLLIEPIEFRGSEDCLYLNVFTPKPNITEAKLPVMVYIHGGAFLVSGLSFYPPYKLLNEEVVFVVISYRLGTLGFLSTEDKIIPGNFGLKDQTMALRFVNKHIHHFGGDPSKVTIFGQSAGAASCHYQTLTPSAVVILQSGTALCPWVQGKSHRKHAHVLANQLNCSKNMDSQGLLMCLQNASSVELAKYAVKLMRFSFFPTIMGPRTDGDYLPESPAKLIKDNKYIDVDMISGVTKDEGAFVTQWIHKTKEIKVDLDKKFNVVGPMSLDFGDTENDILAMTRLIYKKYQESEETEELALTKLFSDHHFNFCHDVNARYQVLNSGFNKRKFTYELSYRGEISYSDVLGLDIWQDGVGHADDLLYLFVNSSLIPRITSKQDFVMSDIITKMWTNFARFGDPTHNGSLGLKWEPLTWFSSMMYLSISPKPSMKTEKRQKIYTFWSSLPLVQNRILNPNNIKEFPNSAGCTEQTRAENAKKNFIPFSYAPSLNCSSFGNSQ